MLEGCRKLLRARFFAHPVGCVCTMHVSKGQVPALIVNSLARLLICIAIQHERTDYRARMRALL